MDDGGGAFISWYSLVVLKNLNLKPRRTMRQQFLFIYNLIYLTAYFRAVLWTAEETGLNGFFGYNEAHKNELDDITFAFESDEGTFTPQGIVYTAGKQGGCILQEILK